MEPLHPDLPMWEAVAVVAAAFLLSVAYYMAMETVTVDQLREAILGAEKWLPWIDWMGR